MKRTTVRLDEHLFAAARAHAARAGETLTTLIEDSLRETLARRGREAKRRRIRLPTFRGRGLASGVDLDDSAALLDLMESSRGAA